MMKPDRRRLTPRVLTPRVLTHWVLAAMLSTPVWAQEQGVDDFEPAVDTSRSSGDAFGDVEPAVDTSRLLGKSSDSAGPAVENSPATESSGDDVDTATLIASDVTRRESAGGVMDEMELGRTEITGNQELPKVLYIVPWQKSDPGDLMGRPVNTLIDEVLAPVDREEFLRQIDYYGDLYGRDEE